MKYTETDKLDAKDPFWAETLSTLEQEASTHRPASDSVIDGVMQRVAEHEEALTRTIVVTATPFSRRYASIMAIAACALFMIGYGVNTLTQPNAYQTNLSQQSGPTDIDLSTNVKTFDYPVNFDSPGTLTHSARQSTEANVVVIQNGVINYPAHFSMPTTIVTGV